MIKSFKTFIKSQKELRKGFKAMNDIKKAADKGGFYMHIDELPLYNFFKIKKGEYKYLWIKDIDKPFNKFLFMGVFQQMHFQFNHLDNEYLRAKLLEAEYESKWIRSETEREKTRWRNEYTTQQKKVETWKTSNITLDEFTDYIESTFNFAPGSIDVHKISTSKAFHSYQKAVEKVKKQVANTKKK